MTHKLIKTENYLLIADESEIKVGDYFWNKEYPSNLYRRHHYKTTSYYKKIISHLPLNDSPILEGVDLLPPYSRHQEDDVDEFELFLDREVKLNLSPKNIIERIKWYYQTYFKAKEKYKYTEEDMRNAWIYGRANYDSDDNTFEQWIEKNQYPTEFISDDEISHEGSGTYSTDLMDIGVSNLKPIKVPKTITTAQGRQWVGKYK